MLKISGFNATFYLAQNILKNNFSEIPNDVSTITFKKGLSLHDTLCTSSNHKSLSDLPKNKLIHNYKSINQSSDSTSINKINTNVNLKNILKTPQDLGMATPEKISLPNIFLSQENSKEKLQNESKGTNSYLKFLFIFKFRNVS